MIELLPHPTRLAVLVLALTAAGMALFDEAGIGINAALFLALVFTFAHVLRSNLSPTYLVHAALALWFALGFAWRDAPCLGLASVTGLFLVGSLGLADRDRLFAADILKLPFRLVAAPCKAFAPLREILFHAATGLRVGQTGSVVLGIVWSLPLLIVFGALLVTADLRFAELLSGIIDLDLDSSLTTMFRFTFWLIVSGALLFSLLHLVPTAQLDVPQSGAALPGAQVVSCIVSLNVLFLSFLGVQASYFFGGDALVTGTPGETYSGYARRGFWELVYIAMLIVPVLYLGDWLLRGEEEKWRDRFRLVALATISLTVLIEASAAHRMVLLIDAYNLTTTRFYATWFMCLILGVLATFTAAILRSKRIHFIRHATYVVLFFLALLPVINPDATVARWNLGGETSLVNVDENYLGTLSLDAYPVMTTFLDEHPDVPSCGLVSRMETRLYMASAEDWRERSYATWRAGSIMAERGRSQCEIR